MAQCVFTDSYFIRTCAPSADTTVDSILQEFRDEILNNVNAKECAPELRRQKVIAEGTETDIEQAKDARKARGVLYDYLRMNCTLEQIIVFSRVLMEADAGLGRTRDVGKQLHARIQESARGQTVSPDESPLHPPTSKYAAHCGVHRRSVAWGTLLARDFVCNYVCIFHASYNIESPLLAGLHVRKQTFHGVFAFLWSFCYKSRDNSFTTLEGTPWKMLWSSYLRRPCGGDSLSGCCCLPSLIALR